MKKQKRNIILLILTIIVIGGGIGFYMFNKGPVNVKQAKAIDIDAVDLYTSFSLDSLSAKKTYANKILAVTGKVKKVSKNQQGQEIVMLETDEPGAYVNCTLEEEAGIKENTTVKLKGICTGMGMSDPDLGILGDVYLTRCYAMN